MPQFIDGLEDSHAKLTAIPEGGRMKKDTDTVPVTIKDIKDAQRYLHGHLDRLRDSATQTPQTQADMDRIQEITDTWDDTLTEVR